MENLKKRLNTAILLLFIAIVFAIFVNPIIILLCWNYIMPYLFGLPEITFWQAFIMSILSTVLFKPANLQQNKVE